MSLSSDPKVVAGKIAHCSRSDCPPTVLAIGQGSLNQAIKVLSCPLKPACCLPYNRTHRRIAQYRLSLFPETSVCSLRHTMMWHLTCPASQHSVRTAHQQSHQGAEHSAVYALMALHSLASHSPLHSVRLSFETTHNFGSVPFVLCVCAPCRWHHLST